MKIRGGNSAVFINGAFATETESGCPRKILLRTEKIEETHDQGTLNVFALGHQFEEYFSATIPNARREEVIETEHFVGHVDFIDDDFIYETKSVSSKKTSAHIKKAPKAQHLMQLGVYMIVAERQKGKIIYGDYSHHITYPKLLKLDPEYAATLFPTLIPKITEFLIEINDDGHFLINGDISFLHVSHILDFQREMLAVLDKDELPPIPEMLPSSSSSPCAYCKLQYLCHEKDLNKEEFLKESQELLDNSFGIS
jgi:CRISPR/Cas system-associated exonuclease Cas4 (RecB family)